MRGLDPTRAMGAEWAVYGRFAARVTALAPGFRLRSVCAFLFVIPDGPWGRSAAAGMTRPDLLRAESLEPLQPQDVDRVPRRRHRRVDGPA